MVREVSEQYFIQMRKSVFTTPKSYLSFLAMYKDLYKKKW
jgi:dynein heavy chain